MTRGSGVWMQTRAVRRVALLPVVIALVIAAGIIGFAIVSYGERRSVIESELHGDAQLVARHVRHWAATQYDKAATLKGLAEHYFSEVASSSDQTLVSRYFLAAHTPVGYALSKSQANHGKLGNIIATETARERLQKQPEEWLMLYRLFPVFAQFKFRDETILWLHYVSNQRDFGGIYPWTDVVQLLTGFGVDRVEQMYEKIYSEQRRRARGIQYDLHQPITWSPPYIDAGTGKPTVTISAQVVDGRKALIGFVGLDIALDKVPELLVLNQRWQGRAYLIDQNGFLVAEYPSEPKPLAIQKFSGYSPALSGALRRSLLSNADLTYLGDHAVVVQTLEPSPWRILVAVPTKNIDQAVWMGWQSEATVTLLMLFAIAATTLLMHFWLIRPAIRLAEFATWKASHDELIPRFWMPWYLYIQKEKRRQRRTLARLQKKIADLERELSYWGEQLKAQRAEHQSFILSVSQDLRSPLRGVSGFAELLSLEKSDQLDDEGQKIIARLQQCARRALRIVEGLLSLSRLTRRQIKIVRVDLSALMAEIVENKSHCLDDVPEVDIERGLEVMGDQELLRVAMTELIDNAIRFRDKARPLIIRVGSVVVAGEVRYFVKDNGIGMPLQNPDMPFRPFVCLHHEGEAPIGEGIGLTRVRQIIRRLGGQVWIESEVNVGTTVWFTLPLLGRGILSWQANGRSRMSEVHDPEP